MNASFFLIRTKKNQIFGPVVKEDLIHRVLSGELDTLDEICPASGYWVFLHEREEVKQLLGVEPPTKMKSLDPDDPDTDTETETATVPLTAIVQTGAGAEPAPGTAPGSDSASEAKTQAGGNPENYTVERPSILKFFLYALMGFLIFVLLRIFQLTQN